MYMIIGAAGFLGSYLIDEILKTTNEEVVAVYRSNKGDIANSRLTWEKCDITRFDEVDNLNNRYKTAQKKIVFCSACHNPDYVYNHPNIAWNINIVSLAYFVNSIENVEIFVYPSTDSVYGNSQNMLKFSEDSVLNPVNTYGKQKVLAEQIVLAYGYNVVRLPFMIGCSIASGKQHFFDSIVDSLKNNMTIEMFADSYRSTLSFRQVSKYIVTILSNKSIEVPAVLNICADDGLSKYDVGLMIAKYLHISPDLVKPISLEDNGEIFKTPRASSTLMDNSSAKRVFNEKRIELDIQQCFM